MGIAEFALLVVVGLVMGMLAGSVRDRGHGRRIDVALGVAGSVASAILALMLGVLSDGLVAFAIAGVVGAGVVLFAQRALWPAAEPPLPRAQRR
jgi:uncharacterized membrane protein YeaQ/YmgE (transglycosylase-associated protein family)